MTLTDLDRVIEALEALEYGERWTEREAWAGGYRERTHRRCPLCAAPPGAHQPDCIAPEALTFVRQMRRGAVEGSYRSWYGLDKDGVQFTADDYRGRFPDRGRALLILTQEES